MRLDKYLCDCGIGTRKDVRALIKSGSVKLDGQIQKDAARHVEQTSVVTVEGERVAYKKYVYIMLNKPAGVVSATFDAYLPTVLDLVDKKYQHFALFPVGRLDIDTTGLLLLTNDGQLAHRLLSPKHHVAKTYYADIEGPVTQTDVDCFARGIRLDDGYVCKESILEILESGEKSKISLTIYEGKFHQVKRMFEAVGKRVLTLKRVSMGAVSLDEQLDLGEMRELAPEEIQLLREI